MEYRMLTDAQKQMLGERLAQAIINKDHPHPADLARAAVILYDTNRLGYLLTDHVVENILKTSGERYSDTMIEWLSQMANSYNELLTGLTDPYYSKHRLNESDFN